ncbi:MAG: endolytic transglycosylase MltG, partial [Mailhella sp.]
IYGLGKNFKGPLLRNHLDDARNRYNTYQNAGLPPGPICSFGTDALKAAISPEQHDYLYFVATGKDKGHSFSKTLAEHNKAVRAYRTAIRNSR